MVKRHANPALRKAVPKTLPFMAMDSKVKDLAKTAMHCRRTCHLTVDFFSNQHKTHWYTKELVNKFVTHCQHSESVGKQSLYYTRDNEKHGDSAFEIG